MRYANTHLLNCFRPNVEQDNISRISNISSIYRRLDDIGHCYSILCLKSDTNKLLPLPLLLLLLFSFWFVQSGFTSPCWNIQRLPFYIELKTKVCKFIVVNVKIYWPLYYIVSRFNSHYQKAYDSRLLVKGFKRAKWIEKNNSKWIVRNNFCWYTHSPRANV